MFRFFFSSLHIRLQVRRRFCKTAQQVHAGRQGLQLLALSFVRRESFKRANYETPSHLSSHLLQQQTSKFFRSLFPPSSFPPSSWTHQLKAGSI